MKALVIEDDVLLKDFIAMCLTQHGFDVDKATDGEKGYAKAVTHTYDVVVLDVNLPRMSGIDICVKMRAQNIRTPIIFLSANYAKEDMIRGLELGADDYLVKPFAHHELVARVRALVRRSAVYVGNEVSCGGILLNTETHRARYHDNDLKLTPIEFKLLESLARHPDTVLSREYLLQRIWGVSIGNTSNRLEVCVRSLRRKLANAGAEGVIVTEYGVGYRLV